MPAVHRQGIVFGREEEEEDSSPGRGVEGDPIGGDAAALERMERAVAPQVHPCPRPPPPAPGSAGQGASTLWLRCGSKGEVAAQLVTRAWLRLTRGQPLGGSTILHQ